MIALIDYGAGNVGSVLKAVEYLGGSAQRVTQPEELSQAGKIILPGQGHFGSMMKSLRERGLLEPLQQALEAGKPFLGICLGLQALYEGSEEAPETAGLRLLPGRVQRLKGVFKVPHVGWSQLEIQNPSRILKGVPSGSFVYFCHSYYGPVTSESAAVTEYGQRFAAAAEIGNTLAVQFHPEKSGKIGLRVLQNFVDLPAGSGR
ncbi:MAG TPA: imidazole glycerol phosphate synthase subunit HisH [Terriglobia bacterium]|nr:imidazole glycerol phosphate synthase subunit HisH [Terriglobia bacterium]